VQRRVRTHEPGLDKMTQLDPEKIATLSAEFERKSPQEIIAWAVDMFCPHIAMSSSFQAQSVPLLYMMSQIRPDMRIFFINTRYHFWETLIFREQLEHDWNLNVLDLYPDRTWRSFLRQFGENLPAQDPDLCCFIRKVQPMQEAVDGLRAWITGIRRDQTPERVRAEIIEVQKDGLLKINPLLNWTRREIWKYIQDHDLPEHPLTNRGFASIGCVFCTRPVLPGEDERAGRWGGRGKTECGLHTEMFNESGRSPTEVMQAFVLQEKEEPNSKE